MAKKVMDYIVPLYLLLLIGSFAMFIAASLIIQEDSSELAVAFVLAYFFFLFLALLGFVFRAWMMVDCALRKFKNKTEKILWVLVIFVAGIIGAVIYYYVLGRKKR